MDAACRHRCSRTGYRRLQTASTARYGQLVRVTASLGRLRILFLQSNLMQEICCCSCVCGVWARIRAWQRVRARPHAHRLPSERLEIHQRTCSPALPDLRAAPLTDLGQCRRRPSAARMQGPGRAAGKRAPASPEGASILPRHSRMLFLGS